MRRCREKGAGRPKDSKNKKAREPDFYFKKYGDEAWRCDGTEQRGHTRRSMVRIPRRTSASCSARQEGMGGPRRSDSGGLRVQP